MRIITVNHTPVTPASDVVTPDVHSLSLETAGMRVSLYEEGEFMVLHCDPKGTDYVGRLLVDEMSQSPIQARLRIRGRRIDEDANLALGTIATEVQNLIDNRMRKYNDETSLLGGLTTLRDFVLGMRRRG